ncbi:hypothetical protein Tel_08185 [Candidatus Tenderia electrophaga]|uniref:Inner membrane protein YgaP-like transmembrane domain-containing protein n=1 Tax=Candidatus Tenderia electrophaga TaxID=1748243 RepID=A0A0S2TDA7_9GAMM|nr:hypothetical protein Tel_08185 [Candidatus Tenderia electrophaga]
MQLAYKNLGAIQNVGWLDRVVRTLIGLALVGIVFLDLYRGVTLGWYAYLPLVALYPLLTGMLGWDPFYAASHVKSCDTSSHNQCGTFPYEVESAIGKDVHCRDGYDCSVPGSERDNSAVSSKTKTGK